MVATFLYARNLILPTHQEEIFVKTQVLDLTRVFTAYIWAGAVKNNEIPDILRNQQRKQTEE